MGGKTQLDAYRVTFQHVEQNHVLYKALINSQGGGRVMQHIRDYLADVILTGISRSSGGAPNRATISAAVPNDVLAHYIAGTEVAMLMWWLEHDRPYTVDQMAGMVHTLILNGIAPLVGHP